MKQPASVKSNFTGRHVRQFLLPALSLLCLLLVGSQFLPGGNFQAHSVTARGLSVQRHSPSLTHVSAHRSSMHRKHHIFQHKTKKAIHQHDKQQKKKHVTTKNATLATVATMAVLAPKATMTPIPEMTQTTNIKSSITATPSVTAIVDPNAPDFYLRQISPSANQLNVGKAISYVLLVGNKSGVTTTTGPSSLTVTDIIPLGLQQITATGTDWQLSLSDTVGPAVLTAQYTGKLTGYANTILPPIALTGILTTDAAPSITNTATVVVPDDKDMDNNTAVNTILIGVPELSSPTIGATATSMISVTRTPAPSGTLTVTPTAITHLTITPTLRPTPRIMPTPKPRITPTPKPRITSTPKPRVTPQPTMTPTLRPTPRITITPKPRVTPTPMRRGTVTPTAVASPIVGSRFSLLINRAGPFVGNHYTVGQKVRYVLQVRAVRGKENQPVTVIDIVSVGLSHIYCTGPGWTITLSNTIGPAALKATFNGPYPLATGTVLPPITIRGTITDAAIPMLSNAGVVTSNDDADSFNNIVVDSIVVRAADVFTATTISSPTGRSSRLSATPTMRVPEATGQPTLAVKPTSMPDGTTGATPAAVGPDLMLVNTNLYGNHAVIGAKVNFVLVVANTTAAATIKHPEGINVDEVIPLGLHNLQVTGKNWHLSLSDTTSPAVIHAQYMGKIGPNPAAALSPISITGDLNGDAVPILTSTALVTIPGDPYTDNNIASNTLFVQHAQPLNAQNIKPHPHAHTSFWQSSTRRYPNLLLV